MALALATVSLLGAALGVRLHAPRSSPPCCVSRRCGRPQLQAPESPSGRDALIIQETDEAVWEDERLEYNGLRADPRTPMPLQSYLGSYKLPTGLKTHAFAGGGTPLSRWLWAGGESAVRGREVPDRVRLSLILDLLDGLNFLHGRGSAHLSLSADVLYVQNGGDAGGIAVGAGAAPAACSLSASAPRSGCRCRRGARRSRCRRRARRSTRPSSSTAPSSRPTCARSCAWTRGPPEC